MAKCKGGKIKILLIKQLFEEQTDPTHTITVNQIIEMLGENGIPAERKAVYSDISALKDMGMDIKMQGKSGYYLGKNLFTVDELALLSEIIASNELISGKKATELCLKLEQLTSRFNRDILKPKTHISSRAKVGDMDVFKNLSNLKIALNKGVQLRFRLIEYISGNDTVYMNNGELFTLTPLGIVKNVGIFYGVFMGDNLNNPQKMPVIYSLDKLTDIEITEIPLAKSKHKFNLTDFTAKAFATVDDKGEIITIQCKEEHIACLCDYFGRNARVITVEGANEEESQGMISVPAVLSSRLYGVLAGLGRDVKIILPEKAGEDYGNYLRDVADQQISLE